MSEMMLTVLRMSFYSVLTGTIILVIRFFADRMHIPKFMAYYLWFIMFITMIIPFSLIERTPIHKAVQSSNTEAVKPKILSAANYVLETNISKIQNISVRNTGNTDISVLFFYVWITVFAIIALYNMIGYIVFSKKIKASSEHYNENIYITSLTKASFVMGLFRPRIYLYAGSEDKDYIIMHEKIHIKRSDNFIVPVAFLITAVHWFNPFLWFFHGVFLDDMEMSCDEAVLELSDTDIRKQYSSALLNSAQPIKERTFALFNNMPKDRILHVLKYKPGKNKRYIGFAALCVSALILLTVSAGNSYAIGAGDPTAETDVSAQTAASPPKTAEPAAPLPIESPEYDLLVMDMQNNEILYKTSDIEFVPNGVFRIFTAGMLLNENIVDLDTEVTCEYEGIYCARHNSPYKETYKEAFLNSCFPVCFKLYREIDFPEKYNSIFDYRGLEQGDGKNKPAWIIGQGFKLSMEDLANIYKNVLVPNDVISEDTSLKLLKLLNASMNMPYNDDFSPKLRNETGGMLKSYYDYITNTYSTVYAGIYPLNKPRYCIIAVKTANGALDLDIVNANLRSDLSKKIDEILKFIS